MVLAWGDSKPGGIPSLGVPLAWGDPKPGGNTSLGDLSPGAFSMEILSPGSSAGEVLSRGGPQPRGFFKTCGRLASDQGIPRPGGPQTRGLPEGAQERGPKTVGPSSIYIRWILT